MQVEVSDDDSEEESEEEEAPKKPAAKAAAKVRESTASLMLDNTREVQRHLAHRLNLPSPLALPTLSPL